MKDNISVYKASRAVRFYTYYRGDNSIFLILFFFCKLINTIQEHVFFVLLKDTKCRS